jgi:hypothetical protein
MTRCPIGGCDNAVEPGPNCYVEVELSSESVKKLVCEDCAETFKDHVTK